MVGRQFDKKWTRSDAVRSVSFFLLHFMIFVVLAAVAVFSDGDAAIIDMVKQNGASYLYAVFCILLLFVITYFYFFFENREILERGKNISLVFTMLSLYMIMACFIGYKISLYARPVALVALMMLMLLGRKEAIFLNIICALLVFAIDTFAVPDVTMKEGYSSLLIAFSAGMVAIFSASKTRTRFGVISIGMVVIAPIVFVIFLLELTAIISPETLLVGDLTLFQNIFMQMGYGIFGALMSAVLFLALLPPFEYIFNCLTVFRLRELTSSDARILKKLKEEAPGTYNHSMLVAQLAEASAAAIGENVDYARAAALYHDVGKLHYPEHFTENQGDYNLHDELTPELSADIIRSHARDGYMLIRNYRLPEFFADVALQHHGTMPIRYFYAKALKMTDGELNIEDFSYVGPKPQTKIAAIIMICDASEAAVRAVNARNPEEVERAIRGVIEERMDLEQFAECDITMADLTKIRQALVNALSGVYHHRIKYPNLKYRRTEYGTKGENE